jgi:nucleoside-triphosphatase THEP1
MGELLFWHRRYYKAACLILAVIALIESGFQRILMLTIIYGDDLWKAINEFLNGLTKQKAGTNYSLILGAAYVLLHVLAGMLAGWIAAKLPGRIANWQAAGTNTFIWTSPDATDISSGQKKKHWKTSMIVIWLVLVILYVQSYYRLGPPLLPSHISLTILLRSLIIVFAWVFIIGPVSKRLLQAWLKKKQTAATVEIHHVLSLLPSMKQLVATCWRKTAQASGWNRIASFIKILLVNALGGTAEASLFLLSAPIQSGKTTSLIKWSETRNDVFGILSPVVNGKRMFMDAHLRQLFDMEADPGLPDALVVGRYRFSQAAFDKAAGIVRKAAEEEGWLVIDEIGPMELNGNGFADLVTDLLKQKNDRQKIILVVREGLIDAVKNHFRLHDAVVIHEPGIS